MSETSWNTLVTAHRATAPGPVTRPPNHEPKAAILACSDARVPPSVIFDQPAGNLFVIRIAGNTAVPSALASLDYAVASLNVDLIVVLGHTSCGAVGAAVAGTCGGHLAPVVSSICEIAKARPDATPDEISALNVAATVQALVDHDGPVGHAARSGHLEIRGAVHDLVTGELIPVTTPTPTQSLIALEAS